MSSTIPAPGEVTITFNRHWLAHQVPNFVAVSEHGVDHLFSVERIQWNAKTDRILLGDGIDLAGGRSGSAAEQLLADWAYPRRLAGGDRPAAGCSAYGARRCLPKRRRHRHRSDRRRRRQALMSRRCYCPVPSCRRMSGCFVRPPEISSSPWAATRSWKHAIATRPLMPRPPSRTSAVRRSGTPPTMHCRRHHPTGTSRRIRRLPSDELSPWLGRMLVPGKLVTMGVRILRLPSRGCSSVAGGRVRRCSPACRGKVRGAADLHAARQGRRARLSA